MRRRTFIYRSVENGRDNEPLRLIGRAGGSRTHFAAGEISEITFAVPYLLNELITLTSCFASLGTHWP